MKRKIKKIHLLPNVITAFGLSCGLFVIFKMTMMELGAANYQTIWAAVGILMLAAFADLLDGAIARAMKAESEFGGMFDSLADAITFGVCPSVIILKTLALSPGSELSFAVTTAAMVYSVSGVLRLVRFSVASIHAKEDGELLAASKKNFTGLPIPAAAAAVVSLNLLFISEDFNRFISLSDEIRAWILCAVLVVIGYFMVSRWKFPSMKTLHVRVGSFQVIFLTVLAAVLIFYGLLHHFAVVFFIFSWGYIVTAWVLSLIRLISGKKSKTLEDFEPEPDDIDWEE